MIFRLFLFVVAMTSPVAVMVFVAYRSMVKPRLSERRARRRGELNAAHSCIVCFETVDTESPDAVYEKGWMHGECRRKLLA